MVRKGNKAASTQGGIFINFDPHRSRQTRASRDSAQDEDPQDPPSGFHANRFEFIDNSSSSSARGNSTQVRRHVMQEFMRKKRWQDRKRQESSPEDPEFQEVDPKSNSPRRYDQARSERSPRQPPSDQLAASHLHESQFWSSQPLRSQSSQRNRRVGWEQENQDHGGLRPRTVMSPRRTFTIGPSAFQTLADLLPARSTEGKEEEPRDPWSSHGILTRHEGRHWQRLPHPQSSLSAARTDPFDCLPISLDQQGRELFDFFVNIMPVRLRGVKSLTNQPFNWYRSVLTPEAMKGAESFEMIVLAHAARAQARIGGLTETPASREHHTRASEMLLKRFNQLPDDNSDVSISATLSAAALEDLDPRVERRAYAWMHYRAAVHKIQDRGGPSAFDQAPRLRMVINWIDYMLCGYESLGASFSFEHDARAVQSYRVDVDSFAVQELQEQCDEFITFLHCTERLAVVQSEIQRVPASARRLPLRYNMFDRDQPLEKLLTAPWNLKDIENEGPQEAIARLASLLTINTAIWEYRHSPELTEGFFDEMSKNIERCNLDQRLSAEVLLQMLLSGSENSALVDTERCWFVGRMLKVAKRLDAPAFRRLSMVLFSHLTLSPFFVQVMDRWEVDLRSKIMRAPLSSHILPFYGHVQPSIRKA